MMNLCEWDDDRGWKGTKKDDSSEIITSTTMLRSLPVPETRQQCGSFMSFWIKAAVNGNQFLGLLHIPKTLTNLLKIIKLKNTVKKENWLPQAIPANRAAPLAEQNSGWDTSSRGRPIKVAICWHMNRLRETPPQQLKIKNKLKKN